MRKVYVTNRGGHDFSAAKKFGDLVFLTEGTIPKFNTSNMFREISEILKESEPNDYILITSLTTLNVVACSYFAHKHGRLNLLLFQPKNGKSSDGDYVERVIVFDQTE